MERQNGETEATVHARPISRLSRKLCKKNENSAVCLLRNGQPLPPCPGKLLLLVLLKDKAGLKYKDICDISVFSDLSFTSLPVLYRRTKKN
jgi:hypothetical protein